MAKRSNDLTLAAQPVAEKLAQRCGSLKHVLSAGVLALNDHSPEEREAYMEDAAALEIPKRSGLSDKEALILGQQIERKKRQAQDKLVKQILERPEIPDKTKRLLRAMQQNTQKESQKAIRDLKAAKGVDSD